jgi:hypothetical protein
MKYLKNKHCGKKWIQIINEKNEKKIENFFEGKIKF